MTDLRIGRRDVKFTHPDKVLFPRAKLTKLTWPATTSAWRR